MPVEAVRLGDNRTQSANRKEADVVVVGAGLAGLAAAHAVLRAGLEPLVLEARDRPGGRVVNESIGDGEVVELGGQWVAPRDEWVRRIAGEHDIGLFPTHDRGTHLLEVGEEVRRYRGKIPKIRPAALVDMGIARWKLDRQARTVPPGTPWTAARAVEWDGQTLGSWLDRTMHTREGRLVMETAMTGIWGGQPQEVNLLQALAFVHAAGDFEALTTTHGGELQDRVVGGSARIVEVLAEELGDRVVYDAPVVGISDNGSGVEVEARGLRVRARRVIVAVPPALADRLRFEPSLPAKRDQALQRLPMAAATKIAAVYDRPFWRDRGQSGRCLSTRGPVMVTFDNSPPGGSPGVLVAFVTGDRARALAARPEAERREAVLACLARLYGEKAASPRQYLEKDWAGDPWSRGCYFGLAAPGSLTGPLRTLAEPIGLIHWAGAETAWENYGGMDGAVLSGERAAAEVLAAVRQAV